MLIFFIGSLLCASGQTIPVKDSLKSLSDSTVITPHDTIVFLLDTVKENNKPTEKNGTEFYRNLKRGAYKRKLTKELYHLFFVNPDKLAPTDTIKTERSEVAFLQFRGKTIRQINIKVLEPFGPTLYDTTTVANTWLEIAANKLHHTSKRGHLKRLLRIKEGQKVDPYDLADNERLIRNLPYIRDAYIRIIPVSGSPQIVDLELWVKDQFSWGANLSISSLSSTEFEIYNRNLYGIGHEFSNQFHYEPEESQTYGYTGNYKIKNIRRSFIDATLHYENTYEKAVAGIEFQREFETYNTKYAGGLTLARVIRSDKIKDNDPIVNEIPLNFNYGNIWLGKSYPIKSKSLSERKRFFVAARVASREFFKRPEIGPETNKFFHNTTLYLSSFTLTKTQFYKSNLIYNFGRTEDIPYGYLAQVTLGHENREFSNRKYLGLNFQMANYLKKSRSYFFDRLSIGGYFKSGRFEQGLLIAQTRFFSRIRKLGSFRFRNFGDLKYTLGIRRFSEEFITLNNRNGIRGFSSDEVRGTQKVSLNLETVAFTPYVVGGFRFALFTFADIGIIGSNRTTIFKEGYYYGLGFGIRLHNENMVFKTIQFRFAVYPNAPSDFSTTGYRLSGEERPIFNDFKVTQPDIMVFE